MGFFELGDLFLFDGKGSFTFSSIIVDSMSQKKCANRMDFSRKGIKKTCPYLNSIFPWSNLMVFLLLVPHGQAGLSRMA